MIHGEVHLHQHHHRLFHNAGWCLAKLSFAAAGGTHACTQRIKIMTRWIDCIECMQERQALGAVAIDNHKVQQVGCRRVKRYIRKVPSVQDIGCHSSNLRRCLISTNPRLRPRFVYLLLLCSVHGPTNVTLQLSLKLRVSAQARVLQLCNSLVCFFFFLPPCYKRCCYRAFTLVRCATPASRMHLPGHDRTDRQSTDAHWRLGERRRSRNALQLLQQHELGAGKGRDAERDSRQRPTASSCSNGTRARAAPLRCCCQCGERVEGASLDHEMGLASALCCKTGCTQ